MVTLKAGEERKGGAMSEGVWQSGAGWVPLSSPLLLPAHKASNDLKEITLFGCQMQKSSLFIISSSSSSSHCFPHGALRGP
ncbi:hypothetical protein FQN60_006159 [Etheostoma spectabile]|uniref:Uncharacterized protein n=1 Tax=Etheostoma spectabile TaxID=54343 RepID=A0A5J5CKL9_9PERO|nr:hypothetical protein FQN60_006159 [Etheostoma spectabile]